MKLLSGIKHLMRLLESATDVVLIQNDKTGDIDIQATIPCPNPGHNMTVKLEMNDGDIAKPIKFESNPIEITDEFLQMAFGKEATAIIRELNNDRKNQINATVVAVDRERGIITIHPDGSTDETT